MIWRYSGFILSSDLAKPRDKKAKSLYRLEPIEVSYHPVKLGGHRHCVSRDKMILVYHVT